MEKARTNKKKSPKTSVGQNGSKKQGLEHYVSTFLKEADGTVRKNKPVQISTEHYEQIQRIVRTVGKDRMITLSDYIDNVLARYFEEHQDEIMDLLEGTDPFTDTKTEQQES